MKKEGDFVGLRTTSLEKGYAAREHYLENRFGELSSGNKTEHLRVDQETPSKINRKKRYQNPR